MDSSIVGKVFCTGNIIFKVENIEKVTKYFQQVSARILNGGQFSKFTVDMGSDELEQGILTGEIWEVPDLCGENEFIILDNNLELDE